MVHVAHKGHAANKKVAANEIKLLPRKKKLLQIKGPESMPTH